MFEIVPTSCNECPGQELAYKFVDEITNYDHNCILQRCIMLLKLQNSVY